MTFPLPRTLLPRTPLKSRLPVLGLALCASLSVSALACPVKPGTLGNGLMPAIAGMKPNCGSNYQQFKSGMTGNAKVIHPWAEMYSIPITTPADNKAFSAALGKMVAGLTSRGYVYFNTTDLGGKDSPRLLNFVNKKTGLVFGYLLVREGDHMTLALTGNGK
jgi:hypothetical protein